MSGYIASRLVQLVVSLFGLSFLVFALLSLVPGDAAVFISGEQMSVEEVSRIRGELGLDDPLVVRYGRWLSEILQGDLGRSLFTKEPITQTLRTRMPVSFELGLFALALAVAISFPLGLISALARNSWEDHASRFLGIVGLAVPNFWLGTMAMVFGARWLDWIPPVGYIPLSQDPLRNLQQFLVPAIVLGTGLAASLMRMLRSSLLEVLRQDYVRTAHAKGLDSGTIVRRHILKNGLIPVVTVLGIQSATLVGGTVVTESIFNLPGMGRLIVEAINRRDYPIVQAVVLAFGSFILLINLLTDLSYAWLDPRISYK